MKLSELLNVKTELNDVEITAVTCDSRQVVNGCAFVCIDGVVMDGHKFANEAMIKGAAVIVAEKDLGLANQIIVPDTRIAFAEMSANWFKNPAKQLKVIGVTGTNGKTSVSYMIKQVLEECGKKVGLIGTIQNVIAGEVIPSKNTTPSSYELNSMFSLMVSAGCEYCVMEVSSHALEQQRVYGVDFDVAIFTNLTQDHLDYHITMENYMNAKKKLFYNAKTAILNMDDSYYPAFREGINCKTVTYSAKNDDADYTAKDIRLKPDGTEYLFSGIGKLQRIKTMIGGKFTPSNTMAAAAAALELGIDLETVAVAISKMTGVKGRAEVVPTGRDFTVIIDYAHTPDGLENILKTFADCEKNRLITVFGCGGDRDKTKRPKMGAIAAEYSDYVIVTSDNPRTEDPMAIIDDILAGLNDTKTKYEVIENRIDAINKAIQMADKDDIIVLAGKGHETYQILKSGTIHLDEREVVAEALKNL